MQRLLGRSCHSCGRAWLSLESREGPRPKKIPTLWCRRASSFELDSFVDRGPDTVPGSLPQASTVNSTNTRHLYRRTACEPSAQQVRSKCEAFVNQVGSKCEPSAGQVQSESGPSAGQVRAKRRQPNAKQARSKCGLSADQAPTKCEASPLVHRSWLSCLVGLVPALACLSFPALSRLLGFLGFCLWPGQG